MRRKVMEIQNLGALILTLENHDLLASFNAINGHDQRSHAVLRNFERLIYHRGGVEHIRQTKTLAQQFQPNRNMRGMRVEL